MNTFLQQKKLVELEQSGKAVKAQQGFNLRDSLKLVIISTPWTL
jgi:hypothetical protein